jgi:hypothetical protein
MSRGTFITGKTYYGARRRPWLSLLAAVFACATGMAYMGTAPTSAATTPTGYSFTVIATLGSAAPGGATYVNDFEPTTLNNAGEAAFTADTDVNLGNEGVFVYRGGQVVQLAREGLPAPGASTFGPGELGRLGLNAAGDVAVPFSLQPWDSTTGIPSGLWRYTQSTGTLSAAAVPGQAMPGGGTLEGVWYNVAINNRGDILFPALATGTQIHPGAPGTNGIALALFAEHPDGTITSVVRPGDAAPGGHVFDDAWNGSANNAGDIVFSGHVVGDSCANIVNPYACGDSLYLRSKSGSIVSIAHQGDPAPGGGTFSTAFGGLINDAGKIVFNGNLGTPEGTGVQVGVFSYQDGTLASVVRPGDPMPGGDALQSAGNNSGQTGMNSQGDIAFSASLNTDTTGTGVDDTGVYVASGGSLRLVARTGTVIPGIGTVERIGQFTAPTTPSYTGGSVINNRGQVVLGVTLTDGTAEMLLATPTNG